MATKNLLVELLVEELPPKSLRLLGHSFAKVLTSYLKAQDLAAKDAAMTIYATPRRLAVHLTSVVSQAEEKSVSHKLMPVNIGLDNKGQATTALCNKLASLGADASAVAKLKRSVVGKTEMLFLDQVVPGMMLAEGLQKAINETIAQLPIPKVMSYQLADGWQNVNFVRPAHRLIALHGDEIVSVSVLGLVAKNLTQGHRFEATANPIAIKSADSYDQQLSVEGAVTASFDVRRSEIAHQLAIAATGEGLKPIADETLLDEVTALVERPNVLVGEFEPEFLDVPQECLILTMKANQKFFPMLYADGKLANKFLVVSNIRPMDASLVIGGNERVVRSRLADAKFFFDQDRKKTLAERLPGLDKVIYHNKIGTQGLRIEYVRAIANAIAQQLGGEELASQAAQAATLAKADLLTEMVGEFPELQGIMGRYYAQYEGLDEDIAFAIEDHYKPRFSGDELPRNQVAICVALADKLETLVSMFGIGQIPTGDKDPFALRRHALGIIRILTENDLPLEIGALIGHAIQAIEDTNKHSQWVQRYIENLRDSGKKVKFVGGNGSRRVPEEVAEQLLAFIYERLAGSLREQGYSAQEVEAVLILHPQNFSDVSRRIAAVRAFMALPEAKSLAAANKRVGNILKKAVDETSREINVALLQEPAELSLYQALVEMRPKTNESFVAGDYTASLQTLAALKLPVDIFFDNVMVNTEDHPLRNNRLALLAQLQQTMNRVADISKLAA
jgi:glycyl-tRNA synthetase beta chain